MIFLFLAACALQVVAQSSDRKTYSMTFENEPLASALIRLSELSGLNIIFSSSTIDDHRIDARFNGSASEILEGLIINSGLEISEQGGQYVLSPAKKRQGGYIINGFVEDRETGERLIAAHVFDEKSGTGASTNPYGYFSMVLPEPTGNMRVSYLGYATDQVEVNALENASYVVRMGKSLTLDEVVIYSNESRDMNPSVVSNPRIYGDRIDQGGHLGGEFDLNRYAASLPGVTTGADGIGGVNVRGGADDQNLILMDGVPVYNPTHAIGILSIFNPLLIQEASLYKGKFPARYAGRLSSVMDVRTREGNQRNWSFTGGIGPLSVNGLIEGPIGRNKGSVLVSYRRFLPGFLLSDLAREDKNRNDLNGKTKYGFDDLNVKANYLIASKDRLYLSYYSGNDSYSDRTERLLGIDGGTLFEEFDKRLRWSNRIGIIRWNHQFGANVFANATITWSAFRLRSLDFYDFNQLSFSPRIEVSGFERREFKSEIEDLSFKWDFDIAAAPDMRLRVGLVLTRHIFRPKSVSFNDEAKIQDFIVDEGTIDDALFSDLNVTAFEQGIYAESEMHLGEKSRMNIGLHLSAFQAGQKWYVNPQPRIHLSTDLGESLTWESNGSVMVQYLQLLGSSGIGLPTDLWVPSTESVRPQLAAQLSTGLHWNMSDVFQLAGDIYYKHFDNLTEYQEGASFLLDEGVVESSIVDATNWETKVTQGRGWSYGFELHGGYHSARTDVRVNYTLSKSLRQFDQLNFGRRFPFSFDRRHTLSVFGGFRVSKVIRASASWTFASGNPITLAESKFLFPGTSPVFQPIVVLDFGERNGYRLAAYHRLDVGINATWNRPAAAHTVSLDLYNAYNRKNALYVAVVENEETQLFESKQFTVLPFIPSLSYQLKF